MQFEELETERLILRKFTPEILKTLFDQYPKVVVKKHLGLYSDEEYNRDKAKSDGGYTTYRTSMILFKIILKSEDRIIGGVGLHNWYKDHSRAEIGYNINSDEDKNKGYMTEAVEHVIEYGFKNMHLKRIEALISPKNIPSLSIIKHFGFEQEGHLKSHYYIDGKYEDSLIFGKLKSV